MATVGLDNVHYAEITEDADGKETYGTPKRLAKALKADLTVEFNDQPFYADDGLDDVIKEFKSAKLTLNVKDISKEIACILTGAKVDKNGVMVSTTTDSGKPVAIGFRSRKLSGNYRYYWFYKVKFAVPSENLQTKGETLAIQTPTIEGTVTKRNKPDANGENPWRAIADGDSTDTDKTVIGSWFTKVYEPEYAAAPENPEDEGV